MKNKTPLVVIGALVFACFGLLAYAGYTIFKRSKGGSASVAGRISRDAFLVANFDAAQLRRWQPANSFHDMLRHPAPGATNTNRELARMYEELIQNCGFVPWEKVNGVTLGVERSVAEGHNQSAIALFVDGTYTHVEAERCLTYLVQRDHQTLSAAQLSGHRVLTATRSGASATPDSTQFAQLTGSTLVAPQQYMVRALAVVDGHSPALASDSPLSRMMTRVGSAVILGAAVDLAELRSRQAQTVDGYINDLAQANPQAPDLILLRQARIGGFSMAVLNGAVTLSTRIEVPTPANAQALATALGVAITRNKAQLLEGIEDVRRQRQIFQATLSMVPGMTEKFNQVDAAFTAVTQVLNQITTRGDENDAVVALNATQPQVTAIQDGVRAFSEIAAELSRRNPLDAIMRGAGGMQGGAPSIPGLPEPAMPDPGPVQPSNPPAPGL